MRRPGKKAYHSSRGKLDSRKPTTPAGPECVPGKKVNKDVTHEKLVTQSAELGRGWRGGGARKEAIKNNVIHLGGKKVKLGREQACRRMNQARTCSRVIANYVLHATIASLISRFPRGFFFSCFAYFFFVRFRFARQLLVCLFFAGEEKLKIYSSQESNFY